MLRIVAECQRLISLQAVTTHAAGTERGRIARLRQSILKWAFEGKLVDQDPNDEPASELLARIKAEREKAAPAATTGRRAPRPKAKRAVVA
jgi:type I restriction enzyme S subunit